MNFFEDIQIIL